MRDSQCRTIGNSERHGATPRHRERSCETASIDKKQLVTCRYSMRPERHQEIASNHIGDSERQPATTGDNERHLASPWDQRDSEREPMQQPARDMQQLHGTRERVRNTQQPYKRR